jgi:hypothetical protein
MILLTLGTSMFACNKSEPTGQTTTTTTQAPQAKQATGKTGKQLLVGKWKLTKAVMDGKDMTKELGPGGVTTFTETSMTKKIGKDDVTSSYTVLKDGTGSMVMKDQQGEESTATFADDNHVELSVSTGGSSIKMSYERM